MEGDRWAPYNTRSKREKTVYSTAPEYGEDDFAPEKVRIRRPYL